MSPALALMYEEGESDLLKRPPRRVDRDHFVDLKLICHAYFFLGLQETFFAHLLYFTYMQDEWGVPANKLFLAFNNWGVEGVLSLFSCDLSFSSDSSSSSSSS